MKAAITPYGAACFGGSDTIRILCKANEARHIVHCVNNYDRLVRMVERLTDECELHDVPAGIMQDARTLLATMEAEKGGEL